MSMWKRRISILLTAQLVLSGTALAATDPTFSSTSYKVIESEIGASGPSKVDTPGASTNYNFAPATDDGGSTLGDIAIGNGSSTSYQSNTGFNTTAQPGLTMTVNTSLLDYGDVLLATKTARSATFNVKNYTSYGYVVQIIGTPPTYAGHALTALTTNTAYNATVEQWGCNTVADTGIGTSANPVQVPSSTFSFGVAGDGSTASYATADQWRFNSGDTIASAPKSTGETDYTLTCMMNVINTTPGGKYTGNLTLVATGTF